MSIQAHGGTSPSGSLLPNPYLLSYALFHFTHAIHRLCNSKSIIICEGVDKKKPPYRWEDCFVQNRSEQTNRPVYCTLCRFEFTNKNFHALLITLQILSYHGMLI